MRVRPDTVDKEKNMTEPEPREELFSALGVTISPDLLIKANLLTKQDIEEEGPQNFDPRRVDYGPAIEFKTKLLKKAWRSFTHTPDKTMLEEFELFCQEESYWLDDYTLFMACKDYHEGRCWLDWEKDILNPTDKTKKAFTEKLEKEIGNYRFIQFIFQKQWIALRDYAHEKGIQIIGDIPIYVAMDSADTWAHPELFQLDEENVPTAVAGCPPDGFSATGQLWGNPLYRWDYHRETGYSWWISRLHYVFQMYDVVRIDHFRGFDEYFSIPYGAENAIGGHWEKGPGIDLFRKVEQALGWKQVIAEDLGFVTDSVREMVRESGFPGMKVLEFAFDSRDSGCANDYLPHNYPVNSVAYTGTHHNETIVGWWSSITKEEQKLARDYMCDQYTPEKELYKSLISLIMRSSAKLCVIPMQDYLGLGNNCRINTPSTVGKNWKWRIRRRELTAKLQKEIHGSALRYGRMNWSD